MVIKSAKTFFSWTAAIVLLRIAISAQTPAPGLSSIGQEVAVPRHLADDEEFTVPLKELLQYGKQLFVANWNEQEGGGRPLTKGNGTGLADPSQPLVGARAFNRLSAPDANSCYGCHNSPYGIPGGGGDFVTNVFVLGQRFDFLTFDPSDRLPTRGAVDEEQKPVSLQNAGNLRASTGRGCSAPATWKCSLVR
jgi:hypothetical protein